MIKAIIKTRCPSLVAVWRRAKYSFLDRKRSYRRLFDAFYKTNAWGDSDSASGPGSSLAQTEAIRKRLPRMIAENHCRSILDIPCGDLRWMSELDLKIKYIGADIVEAMIQENRKRYGDGLREFRCLDLIKDDLPRVDLVLCRDCLIHFSLRNIRRAIRNIKRSGSTYLLTTTYSSLKGNSDIPTGAWRPINLQEVPFRFPPPIQKIDEKHHTFQDRCLALWKIADLPDL